MRPSSRHALSRSPLRMRSASLVLATGLAAGSLAAATSSADGLTTNRPNATVGSFGLAVDMDAFPPPVVVANGGVMLAAVDEASGGEDLNGDGDTSDLVLHTISFGSGDLGFDFVSNRRLAVARDSMFLEADEAVAIVVDEAAQSQDLNGDGDADDHVLHVYDERADEVDSSGLAVTRSVPDPAVAAGTATFAVIVEEAAQGADLNGDGDLADDVLHLYTMRRAQVTSSGLAHATTGLYRASGLPGFATLSDAAVVLLAAEDGEGRDLNGDGDTDDDVAYVVDELTGVVSSLDVAAFGVHDGGDGLVVLETEEAANGRDLDGDGDATGAPLLVTDGTTLGTAAIGVEGDPALDVMAGRIAPNGPGAVAVLPRGADSAPDPLLRYDAVSRTLTDTGGVASSLIVMPGGRVLFTDPTAPPPAEHGDEPTPAWSLSFLEADGTHVATPHVGGGPTLLGGSLVALTEFGDFSTPSRIARVIDIATGDFWYPPSLHLLPWGARTVEGGQVALRVREYADGVDHIMIDGDAVDGEHLPGLWDLDSYEVRTLDVGSVMSWPTFGGDVVIAIDEAESGDQNGDGDATDVVLGRARFGADGHFSGPSLEIDAVETQDGTAAVTVAASSVDATPLVGVELPHPDGTRTALVPSDGVYDGPQETFSFEIAASVGETLCLDGRDADGDGSFACTEVAAADETAPVVNAVTATPALVHPGDDVTVVAELDDGATGGSVITSATAVLGDTSRAMTPDDGAADEIAETYTVVLPAPEVLGQHSVCVTGTDGAGNASDASCVLIEVADLQAPTVADLTVTPQGVEQGGDAAVAVVVDDRANGGSAVSEVTVSLGGSPVASTFVDGGPGDVTERVAADLRDLRDAGDHEVCVTATDAGGNTSEPSCVTLTVNVGEGPVVSGVTLAPAIVGLDAASELTATLDDSATGGAGIASASFTLDGTPAGEMTLTVDGPSEATASAVVDGFATPGSRELCVTGRDTNGNATTTPGCATLTVVDDAAPVVISLVAPETVDLFAPFEVTALADDADHGGSAVTGMSVSVDGAAVGSLAPTDGAFDGPVEEGAATVDGLETPGEHTVCVTATDAAGNTSTSLCRVVAVLDTAAPSVTSFEVPATVELRTPYDVEAFADDTASGGSNIDRVTLSIDGTPVRNLAAADGSYDAPVERTLETLPGLVETGTYTLCVTATDVAGNTSEPSCADLDVVDTRAPLVSGLTLPVAPVPVGEPFTISFVADDSETGGADIAAVSGGLEPGEGRDSVEGELTLAPLDGALDGPTEIIVGTVTGTTDIGPLTVCVAARDSSGNTADPVCGEVEIIGRSVTGEGGVVSSFGSLVGEATFTIDVEETVDGLAGQLTYTDGPMTFVSDSIASLTTEASTTATITGTGTVNGSMSCDFTVTAREGSTTSDPGGQLSISLQSCGLLGTSTYATGGPRGLTSGELVVRGA